jgi:hypothetical protein
MASSLAKVGSWLCSSVYLKGHLTIQRSLTRRYQSKNLFHKLLFKKCVEISAPLNYKVSQRISVQKYKIFQAASATRFLEGFCRQGEFSIRCSTD